MSTRNLRSLPGGRSGRARWMISRCSVVLLALIAVGRAAHSECPHAEAATPSKSTSGPSSAAADQPPPTPQRPNILWLIAEDMGPELGILGHPEVRTPNIDRLAQEGTMYTRAFTTAAVCSPARSALMTGMYQTTIGAQNHRSHRGDGFKLPEGVSLVTDRLRAAGYYTANLTDLTGDPNETFYVGTGKTDWNFAYDGKPFDGERFSDLSANQPFYAQVNFSETHRGHSWDVAHEYVDRPADPGNVKLPPYYPNHPIARADWAQYLNAIMALDKKVGRVLDLLKRDGLDENTVVVFMGDHGRAMVRGKQFPYDSGLHIPLIVRMPAAYSDLAQGAPGSRNSRLVAHIDLTTATLWLAGVKPPALMQGVAFLDPQAPARRYVFGGRDRNDETVDRSRTVRDERYRYVRNFMPDRPLLQLNRYKETSYPMLSLMRALQARGKLKGRPRQLFAAKRPSEELYDTEKDPYELRNLARSPQHRRHLERLRGALQTWIVESGDQGRQPEPKAVTDDWEDRMSAAYDDTLKKMSTQGGYTIPGL